MNKIARSETRYVFDECDYVLKFAEDNKMQFRGHVAVWANTGKQTYQPAFIRDETDPVKIESFLKSHIHKVLGRYSGKAVAWDVINEAIDDKTKEIRDSVWNKVDDFICKSFKWAHEADPHAELFYNDYNHATVDMFWGKKADAVFELVKDLKQRNCQIHGVGF